MDGMDGVETSKKILDITKNWENKPLIIACSADNSKKTIQQCFNIGISQFINKPIQKKFVAQLYKNLKKEKQIK